jgi:predicted permease
MRLLRLWRQLRARRRFEHELDEELEFHLASRRDELVRQGHAPELAQRTARIELGMVELHKDGVRAVTGLGTVDALSGELSRSARALARAPAFALGAVTVLALAIALNLVMVGIYQTYLGNAPSTAEPGALFDLQALTESARNAPQLTRGEIDRLRTVLGDSVRHLAISEQTQLGYAGDQPRTMYGMAVNADYFRMLATKPALGRTLAERDAQLAAGVIVLGHGAWRSLTQADPEIVGKSLVLGGEPYSVIGVMPRGFAGLEPFQPQFWIDAAAHESERQRRTPMSAAVRYSVTMQLAPHATPDRIAERAGAVLMALPDRIVTDERIAQVRVLERTSQLSALEAEDSTVLLTPIFALLLLVLLIACSNLANLVLARALARRRELAVRASIGAPRGRLVGLLLVESGWLAVAGTLLGLILAVIGADAVHDYAASLMTSIGMETMPIRFEISVLPITAALALVATLAIGLAPALAVTGHDLAAGVRRDSMLAGGRVSPSRLRALLMVMQIAASVVLLIATALVVNLARNAGALEVGYSIERLIDVRHPTWDARLRTELERLPGVVSATAIMPAPLYGHTWRIDAVVDGYSHRVGIHYADERFLDTFGIGLVSGRWFSAHEARDGARVAVISAKTAQRLWPGRSALGRYISILETDENGAEQILMHEVIGVVADVVTGLLINGVDATAVYLPGGFDGAAHRLPDLILRIDPARHATLIMAIARACLQHTPGQPCIPWRLSEVVAWQRLPLEIASRFAVGIALLALLISAAGLYGVARYNVAARTREIGVRLALGARRSRVAVLVLSAAMRHVGIGLALSLPLCVMASMLLRSTVGTDNAFPPLAYLGVPVLLLVTTLLATGLPARRATLIEPTEALRED